MNSQAGTIEVVQQLVPSGILAAAARESASDPRSLAGRPTDRSKLLGQVFTPDRIAVRMVKGLLPEPIDEQIRLLDPCVGPSTFPKQILAAVGLAASNVAMTLVDLDESMISNANQWASKTGLPVQTICTDYLEVPLDGHFDCAILNPPYIRQEWIDKKELYRQLFKTRYDLSIPGTANLYVYFIAKVLRDLKPAGRFACIIYDSWQFTKYGRWLKELIDAESCSVKVVPLHQQPFQGRLIDATLIFGCRRPENTSSRARRTAPRRPAIHSDTLSDVDGFSPLSKLYGTKRGLRLKQADFFMCDLPLCDKLSATPFLKKVGRIKGFAVHENHPEAALLLGCEREKPGVMSELRRRLASAQQKPDENVSILTWYKERPNTWMFHRAAPFAPIVFNYYLRNRPRHIYNPERVYSDNFYGLVMPEGLSPFASLAVLNSSAVSAGILAKARNQGNGLAKIQLFEYREVYAPDITQCAKKDIKRLGVLGLELTEKPNLSETTIRQIDSLIASIFPDPRLKSERVEELFVQADLKARRPKEA